MRRRTFLDLLVTGVAGYAVRPSIALTAQPAAWHERLPKVELHLHLEGATPKGALWELITKYGGNPAIPVSLNTDDPLFFGNSLVMELESAQRVHHFTRDEIRQLMLSSIEATWLSAERKQRLAADFQRDPSWNEAGA